MLEVARAVYTKFLECVVARGVFSDAQRTLGTGRPLGNSVLNDVESGARLDGRTPLLGILSGKGGWVPGRAFASREPFVNVTLLDHLASVVRGALVLAEIDLRASGVRHRRASCASRAHRGRRLPPRCGQDARARSYRRPSPR